jgi:hypothetical protein
VPRTLSNDSPRGASGTLNLSIRQSRESLARMLTGSSIRVKFSRFGFPLLKHGVIWPDQQSAACVRRV